MMARDILNALKPIKRQRRFFPFTGKYVLRGMRSHFGKPAGYVKLGITRAAGKDYSKQAKGFRQ